MILVDSSGWIEYLAARPKADLFAPYIEGGEPLLSSVIQVYEIYKVVRRDVNEERAIEAVSALRRTRTTPSFSCPAAPPPAPLRSMPAPKRPPPKPMPSVPLSRAMDHQA